MLPPGRRRLWEDGPLINRGPSRAGTGGRSQIHHVRSKVRRIGNVEEDVLSIIVRTAKADMKAKYEARIGQLRAAYDKRVKKLKELVG